MKATYGGIDILVNNAAICFTDDLDNTLNIMELREAVKNTIFYDIKSISFATYPPNLIMTYFL